MRSRFLPLAVLFVHGLAGFAGEPFVAPAGADIFTFGDEEVLVFADDASGDATPIRVITSMAGLLILKSSLAFDAVHRELVIGRSGGVLVFDSNASGDSLPLRSIVGMSTGLDDVSAVAVDITHDLIYVVDWANASVSVFHRTDDGDVPPIRRLTGALTTLVGPLGIFVDLVHEELYVSDTSFAANVHAVNVFALAAFQGGGDLDLAPVRRIEGPASLLSDPRGLALDLAGDRILVADRSGGLYFYPRTADGDFAPVQAIAGANTQLGASQELQILDDGELLVGTDGSPSSHLTAQAFTASGNANPVRLVEGPATQLTFSVGVASSRARDCAGTKSVDGCIFRDNFEGGSTCDWSHGVATPACPF